MRSLIVILITIVLLGSGFMLYTWMQPARSVSRRAAGPREDVRSITAPATSPANQSLPVSKGEKVFVESFDNKTGNLIRRFRGATWDPQTDGTVKVEQPEAEFFATNGQVLRVRGERGEIVVPSGGSGSGAPKEAMSRAQLPTRGKIFKAHISMFPPGAKRATLSCTVNNLSFDNDTFLLATEEFKDASGTIVPADQVPVTIRGDEYDFDGRGLVMHWDERDQQLASLEIAHGQSLLVKNPKALGIATPANSSPPQSPATKPVARRDAKPATTAVVVNDQPAPATAPATSPATAPATQPLETGTPYRATFAEDVRIEQGGQPIAQCDVMTIGFLMNAADSADEPSTDPASRPAADKKKATGARQKSPPAVAASAPAPAPDAQPIRITWSGKLTMQAAPEGAALPTGKDTIVEMISAGERPVIAKSQDGELRCASFRLDTADNSLAVRNSPAIPIVTVKDAAGTSITTTQFDYSGEHHVATVKGKSHAEFTIAEATPATTTQPARPAQVARVDWSESCMLRMSPEPTKQHGQMSIDRALLRGDVAVNHPLMTLNSRELELSFDPAVEQRANANSKAPNAQIKQMIARDNVKGRFVDPDDVNAKPQSIDTDALTVAFGRTSDNRSYPQKAVADGSVVAGDGTSSLRAEHLEVAMVPAPPATQPAAAPAAPPGRGDALAPVQLESIFAQQDVRATSTDGQEITCGQLSMTQTADGPVYTIQGEVSAPARVSDGAKSLTGPIIKFNPAQQHAIVQGPGEMHGAQDVRQDARQNAKSPSATQPIDITWQKSLEADGQKNLITIDGAVAAKSTLEDGSVAEVLGQRMTIDLVDAPTSRPTKTTAAPTTRRSASAFAFAGSSGAEMNAFRDKVFKVATIDSTPDLSEVRSTLLGADGAILRRMNMFATSFQYEPESKRMLVPVAGRMLYEDRRDAAAPATAPAPAAAQTGNDPKLNLRGATAFEWKKDFIYDDVAHQATMSGDVDVVHKGTGPGDSYRMHAQRVVAEMMPSEPKTAATSQASMDDAKLKSLIADGGVTFSSANLQFIAERVEYDPQKQVLTARGTDRAPATLLDSNGLSQSTFTELRYDVRTDRLEMTGSRGTVRRTSGGSITGSNPESDK